jgi:hypothetical protein
VQVGRIQRAGVTARNGRTRRMRMGRRMLRLHGVFSIYLKPLAGGSPIKGGLFGFCNPSGLQRLSQHRIFAEARPESFKPSSFNLAD